MTNALTDDEQANLAHWMVHRRPDRAHLLREYMPPELDPDEEPYGDASAYHYPRPRPRRPLWRIVARAFLISLEVHIYGRR